MTNDKPMEVVRRRPKKLGVSEGADFGERQKLILESAARLFAESGYAHTTIGDIADEMGISKPVIYHYFRNKDALIRAIFEESDRRVADGWRDIETGEDHGLDELKRLFFFQAEYATTDFGRCDLNTSFQLLSADTRAYVSAQQADLRKEFVRVINKGIGDGSIVKCDASVLTANIIAIIVHVGQHFGEGDRQVALFLNETWNNLVHGLEPRG